MISRWSYAWSPSVMTSAPWLNISAASLGVRPLPAAAFSPLTTMKSALPDCFHSRATRRKISRPPEPMMSPTNSIFMNVPA